MSNPSGSALAFEGPLSTAQLAWSGLRGHGIEAVLLNQNTGSMVQPDRVQVLVPATELTRALEVLIGLGLSTGPGEASSD